MAPEARNATLSIRGMHCDACEVRVREALLDVGGVRTATVSRARGEGVISAESIPDDDALRSAVASAGDYTLEGVVETGDDRPATTTPGEEGRGESLYPLYLIVGFIAGVTGLVAVATGVWAPETIMRHFMAGFFLVFSFFKLVDPPGFVDAYRGYDLIARRVPAWGWVYPFVELALGVAYLLAWAPVAVNVVTLTLMLVGAAGVLRALLDRRAIRCACLGTALDLPMTTVTLVEDLAMAGMAAGMLVMLVV